MSAAKKLVLGLVGTRMTTPAVVERVETVSDRYRLIDLRSAALVGQTWEPAAKIQVDVGEWDLRTYTPLEIEPGAGRTRLLFFLHGTGTASQWARDVRPGTATRIAGPKASLTLTDLTGPAVFFGDETSLAAAATLQTYGQGGGPGACVFEVGAPDEAQAMIAHLGLAGTMLVARRDGAAHLAELVALLRDRLLACSASDLVLTGNGRSIQAVRAALKASGQPTVTQRVKAYWSPGKIGLD